MSAQPIAASRRKPPGTVLAVLIMLVIGGVQTVLQGIIGVTRGDAGSAYPVILYGLLYPGLAWAILRGFRWARTTLLALCGVGLLLALARLTFGDPVPGLITAAWTAAYAILISTRSARDWFRRR